MVPEDNRPDETGQSVDLVRGDSITLSSLPQQRRMREYQDERMENAQQVSKQNIFLFHIWLFVCLIKYLVY